MKKRIISLVLTLVLIASVIVPSVSGLSINGYVSNDISISGGCESEAPFTVTKISNPDRTFRMGDGLIEGGDRETSYAWCMADRGDYIYIGTNKNIGGLVADALVAAFAEKGVGEEAVWAIGNVLTNGEVPRPTTEEGGYILRCSKETGEIEKLYTAPKNVSFRMAIEFDGNVYFGSYAADAVSSNDIFRIDEDDNIEVVFSSTNGTSMRAACTMDDKLYFGGVDESYEIPAADAGCKKLAILQKDDEDDGVWNRVADYKDFGKRYAMDPGVQGNITSPIWDICSYDGSIYATVPNASGFAMFKGHPAADGESANEYGWHWEEVIGFFNGVNNIGLCDDPQGNTGAAFGMLSVTATPFTFNDELYVMDFDMTIYSEIQAVKGIINQIATKTGTPSQYLAGMYDTMNHPQSVWRLDDESGQFVKCEGFSKVADNPCTEYLWRTAEYDGELYIGTMDSSTIYNYVTRLTNGSFLRMTPEEWRDQINYIKILITMLANAKGGGKLDQLRTKLIELKTALESFDLEATADEEIRQQLMKISELRASVNGLIEELKARLTAEITPAEDGDLAATGSLGDDGFFKDYLSDFFSEDELQELYDMLDSDIDMPEPGIDITVTINEVDWDQVKENTIANVKAFLEEKLTGLKTKLDDLYNKVDWEGVKMYAYISCEVGKDVWGFELFKTADGENYEPVAIDGFGDKYNYGARTLLSTDKGLYIGTANPFYGTQLFLLQNNKSEPEAYTLSGKATSFKTNDGVDDVTLKLTGSDNNYTDEVTVTAAYNGNKADTDYSFENVPAGSYVLSVAKGNHVTREYEVAVSADTTQDVKICPIGDADNNGRVNSADAKAVFQYGNEQIETTDSYKLACADVASPEKRVNSADAKAIFQHANEQKSLWTVTAE